MSRVLISSLFAAALLVPVTPVFAQDQVDATVSLVAVATPAPVVEAWMVDRPVKPSASLKVLYGSYAALQALDVYSTSMALGAGGREANPMMNTGMGQALGFKAAMGLSTYYAVHKLAKKNRKAAVVTMAVLNGVTAAVVANNVKNSRR